MVCRKTRSPTLFRLPMVICGWARSTAWRDLTASRFKIFKKSNTPALPMNRISSLRVDAAGRLWILTEDPNTLVLCEQGKFRAFVKGTDFNADYIYNASMADGALRFQSGADSYVYSQGKFERHQAEEIRLPRVFYAPDSTVWITTNDGYYAVDEKQSKFYQKDVQLPFDRRKASATDFAEIDDGLWFMVPLSPQRYRLCVFRNGNLKTSSVEIQAPKFLISDKEGNFWLGDFYDGVRKIAIESIRHDDHGESEGRALLKHKWFGKQ